MIFPLRTWGAFLVFALTLFWFGSRAPTGPGWRDGAEINLVAETLSILHPPGAPLHTLLARSAAATAASPERIDLRINRFSSLAIAVAAASLSFLTFGSAPHRGPLSPILALAASAWALAAPGTAIFGSTGEVYAIAALLALWITAASASPSPRPRLLAAYLLGLGLGVHPLLLFLLPLLDWRRGLTVPLIALGASTFLLLPLRSILDPLLDWGDPENFVRFWRVITAAEFSSGLTALQYAEQSPLRTAWISFSSGAAGVGFALACAGSLVAATARDARRRRSLLAALPALLVASLYLGGGIDVEGYLMVPRFVLALGMGRLAQSIPASRMPALGVGVGILASTAACFSALHTVRNPAPGSITPHAEEVLEAIGPRGLLLTDTTVDYFAALHSAHRQGRPVPAIYTPFLSRPWYRRTLRRQRPDLILPEPRDGPITGAGAIAQEIVRRNSLPLYYSPASRPLLPAGWLAPRGPVFRASHLGPPIDEAPVWTPTASRGPGAVIDDQEALRLGLLHASRAIVFAARADPGAALAAWSEAARLRPDDPGTAENLARALMEAGWIDRATQRLDRAIEAFPRRVTPRVLRSRAALLMLDAPSAVEHGRGAIAVAPTDPRAHAALGAALAAARRLDEAATHLHRALELGGADPAVATLLDTVEARRER
ncbi:MAG: hypothetical protein CME06_17665 [Gemmatimonadetes bacterium]|nr:hypothetical protein [Gemmatimonadota bacterium]